VERCAGGGAAVIGKNISPLHNGKCVYAV
jgi:hypothetical protein